MNLKEMEKVKKMEKEQTQQTQQTQQTGRTCSLPAASIARTKKVCLPSDSAVKLAVPVPLPEGSGDHSDRTPTGDSDRVNNETLDVASTPATVSVSDGCARNAGALVMNVENGGSWQRRHVMTKKN